MNYENVIFDIMLEAGEKGLTVSKIAKHVHHEVNSLFEQIDYEEVYRYVRNFVNKESRNSYSFLVHTHKRGYYRLNKNSEKYRQLFLNFNS
jgi:hypothetical protein